MKVVTRVIANLLKPTMEKLAGDTQSNFILGRQVVDNIFLASEIMDSMKKKKVKKGLWLLR